MGSNTRYTNLSSTIANYTSLVNTASSTTVSLINSTSGTVISYGNSTFLKLSGGSITNNLSVGGNLSASNLIVNTSIIASEVTVNALTGSNYYGDQNVINLNGDVIIGEDLSFANTNVVSADSNTASATNLYLTIAVNGSGFALPLFKIPFALGHVEIGEYIIH